MLLNRILARLRSCIHIQWIILIFCLIAGTPLSQEVDNKAKATTDYPDSSAKSPNMQTGNSDSQVAAKNGHLPISREESASEEEREAMELGGIVTLDYTAPVQKIKQQNLEVGTVELSARVNISQRLVGFITLLAEGNLSEISIDQAAASFTFDNNPVSVLFGQHLFNHGLLSTHLISDPMGIDLIEMKRPGITANFGWDKISTGCGITVIERETDPPEPVVQQFVGINTGDTITVIMNDNTGEESPHREIGGVLNFDYSFLDESLMRVSTFIYQRYVDADFALGLCVGGFSIDGEVFAQVLGPEDGDKPASYLAGVAWAINDRFELAFRNDGLSPDLFSDMDLRFGAGFTFSFLGDAFLALEYSYLKPYEGTGDHGIALQIGLESKLKLPGFQRKTLTRE